MAHEIHINLNGKASMAYVEETPWHGLGQKLSAGSPIEVWTKEAGMDFTILSSPLTYVGGDFRTAEYPGRQALFRSDTGAPLGLVGDKYKVVQPIEVMDFFRELTEVNGFEMETAGVLFGGSKYWALAKTGHETKIGGAKSKDAVGGYVLLATACDGTLQTTAQFTTIRVVCNNTLSASLNAKDRLGAIKVSHRSVFDGTKIREQLGIDQAWSDFTEVADELSRIKVSEKEAAEFVVRLMGNPERTLEENMKTKSVSATLNMFNGDGRGSHMKSSKDTAWGLVNAVTEFVDHLDGNSPDNRLRMAWFYDGGALKQRAFREAMLLGA